MKLGNNMSKLWAFGDSFIYGEDVAINETFSHYIATDLNLDCINFGKRGCCNTEIVDLVLRQKFYMKKDDFILICLTTPHRDEHHNLYNIARDYADIGYITLEDYCLQIKQIEDCLKGFNYIITQGFNPVFGYDYKLDPYIEPKNFIEWGKPNNTVVDIISLNWLENNQEHLFFGNNSKLWKEEDQSFRKDYFARNQKHPSKEGHRLIADKLLEYINYGKTKYNNTKY